MDGWWMIEGWLMVDLGWILGWVGLGWVGLDSRHLEASRCGGYVGYIGYIGYVEYIGYVG